MINLTKNIKYNVAYEYRGWRGNFSAKYLGENFFEISNGDKIKMEMYCIVFAIPC